MSHADSAPSFLRKDLGRTPYCYYPDTIAVLNQSFGREMVSTLTCLMTNAGIKEEKNNCPTFYLSTLIALSVYSNEELPGL